MRARHKGKEQEIAVTEVWYLEDVPDLQAARNIFWSSVKLCGPVVLEYLNDAILGLVFCAGQVGVLYDTSKAREIWDTSWMIYPEVSSMVRDYAYKEAERRWHDMLDGDFGPGSPYFAL